MCVYQETVDPTVVTGNGHQGQQRLKWGVERTVLPDLRRGLGGGDMLAPACLTARVMVRFDSQMFLVQCEVRLKIIRNDLIQTVGKCQSCMVSKLRIIFRAGSMKAYCGCIMTSTRIV